MGGNGMNMLCRGFLYAFLIYLSKCYISIRTNKDYYVPFENLEVNCTSTEKVRLNLFEIYIDSALAVSLGYNNGNCAHVFASHHEIVQCKGVCKCTRDGKSVSMNYNVTMNKSNLTFLCKDIDFSASDSTVISRARGPDTVLINVSSLIQVDETKNIGPVACTADCFPDCNYRWTGPGGFTTSGPVLLINSITRTENGTYTCIANNIVRDSRLNLDIEVRYSPNDITLNSTNQTFRLTEGLTFGPLSCSAQCFPPCNFSWNGPRTNEASSVMYLPNINRNNTGQFTCTASNSIGTYSKTVNVTVEYGPSGIYFDAQSPVELNEGQHLRPVSCLADCYPDCTYKWIGPAGFIRVGAILQINHVNRTDAGAYTCRANNSYNESSGNIDIIVRYRPDMILLNHTDQSIIMEEGKTLGPVSCTAQCIPSCDLTWTGPGVLPIANNLYILHISRNNTGHFMCTANNTIGEVQTGVNVTVKYAAEVTVMSISNIDKDYVRENTSSQFICKAIGEPKPMISWWFTDLSGNTKLLSTNSMFTVDVSCKDTGKYTCEAKNEGFLPQNASKTLNVTCVPRLLENCSTCRKSISVRRNEIKSISACFLSNPLPESNWKKQYDNNSFKIHDSNFYNYSSLLYTTEVDLKLAEEKEVNLTISVVNSFGVASTSCRLRLEEKPFKPLNLIVSCKEINTIEWTSNFNGGSEQVFLIKYYDTTNTIYRSAENVSDNGANEIHRYILPDLKPQTHYSFSVVAVNRINTTESKIVTCTTTSTPIIGTKYIALMVGTLGGGIVCVMVFVVGLTIFLKRRMPRKSTEKKKSLTRSPHVNQEENADAYELKDNPLYGSHENETVEYSTVSKQNKRQQEYENSENLKTNMSGDIYGNQMSVVKIQRTESDKQQKKNKDGLIYVDLDLAPCGSEFVIRGIKNTTNYALIDLTKTADPLPSSDEEDTTDT